MVARNLPKARSPRRDFCVLPKWMYHFNCDRRRPMINTRPAYKDDKSVITIYYEELPCLAIRTLGWHTGSRASTGRHPCLKNSKRLRRKSVREENNMHPTYLGKEERHNVRRLKRLEQTNTFILPGATINRLWTSTDQNLWRKNLHRRRGRETRCEKSDTNEANTRLRLTWGEDQSSVNSFTNFIDRHPWRKSLGTR